MRKIVSLLTLMLFISVVAWSQGKISGVVRDQNGDPVPFATVNVKGSKVSVAADANANFSLNAKSGDVLHITAVGYDAKDVTVGDSPALTVALTRNSGTISDVVVTTALGVQRQAKSLGYSTTKVTGANLTEAKVTNIATGLAAKVAGLQINLVNNGVNPDVRVTLRGARSFLGNNQALLVVDGNVLPIRFLNSLNPNDVDNITVLKGASASVLYGTDASNGVIIVTTKKGKGRPTVTFASTVSMETVAYMPKLQERFGQNGGEYNTTYYPSSVYFPGDPFRPYVPYENQQYGPEYNGATVDIGQPVRIYNADGTYFDSTAKNIYSNKKNSKRDFFDKGITVQNDVSFQAGDENSNFFLSFQDMDAKGVVPKDVNHRDVFRVNGTRIYGKFRADYSLSYSATHTNTTPGTYVPFRWGTSDYVGNYTAGSSGAQATGGSYFQGRPVYWTVINTPSNVNLRDYRNWQTDPFASPDGFFDAYYGNPWWQIDQTRLDEKNNDFIGSASLNYQAFSWMSISYRFAYARNDYSNKYTKAGYVFAPWAIELGQTGEGGNIASSVQNLVPTAGTGSSSNQRITSDLLVTLKQSFLHHDLDATLLLGNQVLDKNFKDMNIATNALILPDFYNVATNLSGVPSIGEFYAHSRSYGVFADLSLNYKNFLFLEATARNDWSSLLSPENRSFFYPGVNGAFAFTELLKQGGVLPWLSYGKVRAAYSQTGQVSVDPYSLKNIFTLGPGFPYGGTGGFTVGDAFANPNIKPERTTEVELGLDLGFFQDRVKLSAAFYQQKTIDQTIPISISIATGFTQAFVNSGQMENKGVELEGSVNVIKSQNFRWDVGGNFSYNKSTVLSIGYGLNDVYLGGGNTYAVVGKPYGVLKVSDWQRDPAGRIVVDKTTGFPEIGSALQYFGTTTPPSKIGLNTTLRYKGFTFNIVADGRFGGLIYNDFGQDLDFTGSSWYSAQAGRQAFVIPNSVYSDGKGGYVPNTNVSVREGNNVFWASTWSTQQSPYVNSADFWKLREVSLNYQFPQSLMAKIKFISALNVGLVGRNLMMFKAKDNPWSDPEYSNTSGNGIGTTDVNQTPPTRFYGATIQVTF